jgi:iron complex transport system substrate-binding protein
MVDFGCPVAVTRDILLGDLVTVTLGSSTKGQPVRIVSLLPSLTELVFALGRGEDLVGVTHECDFPPEVAGFPYLTRSHIPAEASSAVIDELVSAHHESLYELDEETLAELAPDLILTQEQCDVCAVNEKKVREAASRLAGSPHVECVNPMSLADVFAMFRRIGDLLDRRAEAESIVARFEHTAGEIARRREGAGGKAAAARRVLLLEWLDPPFGCGHWNPEIIERAGGSEVIGRPGEPARRIAWEQVASSRPEVVIAAPCGFTLDRAELDVRAIEGRPEWRELPAVEGAGVVLVDGSSFFSRPGPRLETSLRIAAAAIDPERCGDLAPAEGQGWRRWPGRE